MPSGVYPRTKEHNANLSIAASAAWRRPRVKAKHSGENNPNWKERKWVYGGLLTAGEYHKMFEKQHGVCAICGKPETRKAPQTNGRICRLHIDHDHKTGKVRGLLCSRCNIGLGHFMDNIEFLLKAIRYLKDEIDEKSEEERYEEHT